MKPDHFRDIIATNALYRPGPLEGGMVDDYIQVKHGRKQAEYQHPVMKEILEETHGVMVYQEQVMRILNRLGGIELSNAYRCIKAISKKKVEMIAKFREEFIEGAHGQGARARERPKLFGMIEKFAGYGFNKSPLDRLRADRLHDGLPEGPLSGRVHGGPAVVGNGWCGAGEVFVEHIEDCKSHGDRGARRRTSTRARPISASRAEGRIHFGLAGIKGVGQRRLRRWSRHVSRADCTRASTTSLNVVPQAL